MRSWHAGLCCKGLVHHARQKNEEELTASCRAALYPLLHSQVLCGRGIGAPGLIAVAPEVVGQVAGVSKHQRVGPTHGTVGGPSSAALGALVPCLLKCCCLLKCPATLRVPCPAQVGLATASSSVFVISSELRRVVVSGASVHGVCALFPCWVRDAESASSWLLMERSALRHGLGKVQRCAQDLCALEERSRNSHTSGPIIHALLETSGYIG